MPCPTSALVVLFLRRLWPSTQAVRRGGAEARKVRARPLFSLCVLYLFLFLLFFAFCTKCLLRHWSGRTKSLRGRGRDPRTADGVRVRGHQRHKRLAHEIILRASCRCHFAGEQNNSKNVAQDGCEGKGAEKSRKRTESRQVGRELQRQTCLRQTPDTAPTPAPCIPHTSLARLRKHPCPGPVATEQHGRAAEARTRPWHGSARGSRPPLKRAKRQKRQGHVQAASLLFSRAAPTLRASTTVAQLRKRTALPLLAASHQGSKVKAQGANRLRASAS